MAVRLPDVYRRAELGIRLGSADYAIDLCERVLETFPYDPRARVLLGQASLERGKLDDARRHFEQVLERDPECLPAHVGSGVVHTALGNLGAAVRAFERAHDLQPDDVSVSDSLSRLYLERNGVATRPSAAPPVAIARWHLRHGNLEHALELAGQILVGRPGEVLVMIARGEALWRAGRFADAERACRRLLARHPLLLKPRYILGHLLASDAARAAEGVDLLHATLAEDAGGTIAHQLFAPAARNAWSDDAFRLPVLGDDLVLPLPDRLSNAPFDLEAARSLPGDAPPDADRWRPPEPEAEEGLADPLEVTQPEETRSPPARTASPSGTTHLIAITRWKPLVARYGLESRSRLERRLQVVARELGELGCRLDVVGVDDPVDVARFDLPPVESNEPDQIKAALDGVLRTFREDDPPDGARPGLGVLILGGDDVVPFFRLPNPAGDDEPEILTDNLYGAAPGDSIYAPSRAVGRFPDGAAGNLALLFRQIDGLIDARRRASNGRASSKLTRAGLTALNALVFGRATSDALACTAETSRLVAEQVAEAMASNTTIRSSPPVTAAEFDARWLANRRYLYFSLRGTADEPAWRGQGELDPSDEVEGFPRVLYPDLLAAEDLSAPFVFAEVGHAARILGRSTHDSLALRFLSEGAAGFVGPTASTYSAADRPVAAASLLARLYFRFLRAGESSGEALRLARREAARAMVQRQGYLDGDDQKVLLQYVLLGDPLVVADPFSEPDPAIDDDGLGAVPCLCDASSASPFRVDLGVRRAAMEYLLEVAPDVADGSIRVVQRHACAGGCPHPGHAAWPGDESMGAVIQVLARKDFQEGGVRARLSVHLTMSAEAEVVKALVQR